MARVGPTARKRVNSEAPRVETNIEDTMKTRRNCNFIAFNVILASFVICIIAYLTQHLTCLIAEERLMRSTEPDDVPNRLLPTIDLDKEFKMPTIPIANVSIPSPKLYPDTTPYPFVHSRALHGRLAANFPLDELPELTLSLDREFPDFRDHECTKGSFYQPSVQNNLPSASVVIIFADEPFETLMRSVHSVLNNTPPHLLKEIILVDDGSEDPYITQPNGLLEKYITHLPKVFLTRTGYRSGIMRARTTGILHTTSDIFVILDSHIEAEPGWLEPLVYRVQEEPFSFVTPLIDSIQMPQNYKPIRGGIPCHLGVIWRLQDHAFTPNRSFSPKDRVHPSLTSPTSSPVMAGGLFAANKNAFFATGGYDLDMANWGAENVEMGFRLWMCGARIDCMPCSRVAHIFDRGQTYSGGLQTSQGINDYNKNRLRTAAVWMDEFAGIPHQILGRPSYSQAGDLTQMFELRKNLQCKNFDWFLKNVWPESHIVELKEDLPYNGPIRPLSEKNVCLNGGTILSRGVRRDTTLNAVSYSNYRTGGCPWFFYFQKISAIAAGNDDEAILYDQKHALYFDWNRDGTTPYARWHVNRLAVSGSEDIVIIFSEISGKCLSYDNSVSQGVKLAPCDPNDDHQMWLWARSEETLDMTNHYNQWLQTELPDLMA